MFRSKIVAGCLFINMVYFWSMYYSHTVPPYINNLFTVLFVPHALLSSICMNYLSFFLAQARLPFSIVIFISGLPVSWLYAIVFSALLNMNLRKKK